MTDWWMAREFHNDPAGLLFWVFWVVFSITLHELGHGWAAIRAGDRTPIDTGHMTWNPVVHMGSMSLLLFALVGIAWGSMPVNPSRFRRTIDDAIVAAAGPAMNLGLAAICFVLGMLWQAYATGASAVPSHIWRLVDTFLTKGVYLNVALMMLNLIPLPPLDGSVILATFSRGYRRLIGGQNAMYLGMIAFGVVFLTARVWLWPTAGYASGALMTDAATRLPGAAPPGAQVDRMLQSLTESERRAIVEELERAADRVRRDSPPAQSPPR